MFTLHLFNSVKLCYSACLKHLMVLIKKRTANSEVGARMGRLAGREYKIKEEPRPRKARSKRENKERRTPGASHPVTQQTTE